MMKPIAMRTTTTTKDSMARKKRKSRRRSRSKSPEWTSRHSRPRHDGDRGGDPSLTVTVTVALTLEPSTHPAAG